MGLKCEKCYRPLLNCQGCGGHPNRSGLGGLTTTTCSKCSNTGQVCPTHGGHWQK